MFADRAKSLAADATALVHWMKDAPPSAERDALRASYTKTLQSIYIMAAVVAATAMIASFWIQHYDLDQQHETDHGLDEGGVAVQLAAGRAKVFIFSDDPLQRAEGYRKAARTAREEGRGSWPECWR